MNFRGKFTKWPCERMFKFIVVIWFRKNNTVFTPSHWNTHKNMHFTQVTTYIFIQKAFKYQYPTNQSAFCYGRHHESCCKSEDGHCELLCMYKAGEARCLKYSGRPFYIQNLHQGCELDSSRWNILPREDLCHCTVFLQVSNIFLGTISTSFWKIKENFNCMLSCSNIFYFHVHFVNKFNTNCLKIHI